MEQDYHKVATPALDANVHKMATELKDTPCPTVGKKISSGDMIAMDAAYHKHCLTGLSQGKDPVSGQKNQVLVTTN